jgi:hypothetical protein
LDLRPYASIINLDGLTMPGCTSPPMAPILLRRSESPASRSIPRNQSNRADMELNPDLILRTREAPSRRIAAGSVLLVAVLRDARPKWARAPQDDVRARPLNHQLVLRFRGLNHIDTSINLVLANGGGAQQIFLEMPNTAHACATCDFCAACDLNL